MRPLRGDIGWFRLNPIRGSEQSSAEGPRPCVVLSDIDAIDAAGYYPLYVVVPLTAALQYESALCPRIANPHPGGVTRESVALVPQIRALDGGERLVRVTSPLSTEDMSKIEASCRLLLVLPVVPNPRAAPLG